MIGIENGLHARQCMSEWERKLRSRNIINQQDITIFTLQSRIISVSSCLYTDQMSCELLMNMSYMHIRKVCLILISPENESPSHMKVVALCMVSSENRGIHLNLQWLF